MTRARIAAAAAGILTVLLLQATVIAPVTAPYPVSLPAVLVAAIALANGPGTGMSIGFAAGLTADLGSRHPAGVLALCWLGIGLVCGMLAQRRSLVRDAIAAGIVCAAATAVADVLLVMAHSYGTAADAALQLPVALGGNVLLALGLVPLIRRALRSEHLRPPHPVYSEVVLDGRRG